MVKVSFVKFGMIYAPLLTTRSECDLLKETDFSISGGLLVFSSGTRNLDMKLSCRLIGCLPVKNLKLIIPPPPPIVHLNHSFAS